MTFSEEKDPSAAEPLDDKTTDIRYRPRIRVRSWRPVLSATRIAGRNMQPALMSITSR